MHSCQLDNDTTVVSLVHGNAHPTEVRQGCRRLSGTEPHPPFPHHHGVSQLVPPNARYDRSVFDDAMDGLFGAWLCLVLKAP